MGSRQHNDSGAAVSAVRFPWNRTTIEIPYGLRLKLKQRRDKERISYSKLIETMLFDYDVVEQLRAPSETHASALRKLVRLLNYMRGGRKTVELDRTIKQLRSIKRIKSPA